MANLEQLERALRNADAAGDVEAARRLAQEIQRMRLAQPAPPVESQVPGKNVGMGQGIMANMAQGATMGFGEEIGAFNNALMNTVGRGIEGATGWSPFQTENMGFGEAYRTGRDRAREGLASFAEENPGVALASEIGGGLLTGVAGMAKTGAAQGAKGLLKALGMGTAQGGAYGAGTSEAEDLGGRLQDAAAPAVLGGALGLGLPAAGMGIGKMIGAKTTPEAERLIGAGVESLTRSQKLGQKSAQGLEGTLQKIPFVGKPLVEKTQAGRREFQTALMKRAGFPDDLANTGLITDDAVIAAGKKLGDEYTKALKGKTVDLSGDDFLKRLSSAVVKHSKFVGPNQRKEFGDIVRELTAEAKSGPLPATTAHEYRVLLSDLAWANRDERIGGLYRAMRDALDDEFDKIGGIKGLNQQYSRFRQIRDAYESSGAIETAEGILPLNQLERRSKKANIKDREWRDLINSAQQTLPDKLPDSGTASRLATLKLLGNMVAPTAGSAYLGGPLGAMAPLALLGGGRLASSYLASGRLPNLSTIRQYGLLANPIAQPLLGQ